MVTDVHMLRACTRAFKTTHMQMFVSRLVMPAVIIISVSGKCPLALLPSEIDGETSTIARPKSGETEELRH